MGRLISLALRMPSPLIDQAPPRGDRRPALGDRRRAPARLRARSACSPSRTASRGSWPSTSARPGRGGRSRQRRPRPSSWPATSARSAGRRPSSTRKAARSATGAASTSAESRSAERLPVGPPRLRLSTGARGGRRVGRFWIIDEPRASRPTIRRPAPGSRGSSARTPSARAPRIEALVDTTGARGGRSVRRPAHASTTGHARRPASPPIELDFPEVAEGRSRFAWCAALGERIRAAARELLGTTPVRPLTAGRSARSRRAALGDSTLDVASAG